MESGAASSPETWDAFFSDFYLRAYAEDGATPRRASRRSAPRGSPAALTGGDVLDVACGFGRHAVALAEAGFRVVGVDRSQTLLDEAARRADDKRRPKSCMPTTASCRSPTRASTRR